MEKLKNEIKINDQDLTWRGDPELLFQMLIMANVCLAKEWLDEHKDDNDKINFGCEFVVLLRAMITNAEEMLEEMKKIGENK